MVYRQLHATHVQDVGFETTKIQYEHFIFFPFVACREPRLSTQMGFLG
jgi:hypothetical protein